MNVLYEANILCYSSDEIETSEENSIWLKISFDLLDVSLIRQSMTYVAGEVIKEHSVVCLYGDYIIVAIPYEHLSKIWRHCKLEAMSFLKN